jgi:hypothetical protein
MAVRGRKVEIDLEELEKLCLMQASDGEIADFYGISIRTLERRRQDPVFAEVMSRGRAKGKLTVRRHQFRMLEEGNASMGIWLGKQYLGQCEQPAVEITMRSVIVIARPGSQQADELPDPSVLDIEAMPLIEGD